MRHRYVTLMQVLVLICLPVAGGAELSHTVAPLRMGGFTYRGSVAGVDVMELRSGIELRDDGYAVGVAFRTLGMLDLVMHGDTRSRVDGVWRGNRAMPTAYESAGVFRGRPRRTEITYPDGQPHVLVLEPQQDIERDPVPSDLQQGTIDALSALADLERMVSETGRCDGELRVFDGRRLASFVGSTGPMETLGPGDGLSYAGPALRCDVVSRQIAGLPKDASPDDVVRRPQLDQVWFAQPQPGMPPIPVRISVELRLLGHLTLVLTQAQRSVRVTDFSPKL